MFGQMFQRHILSIFFSKSTFHSWYLSAIFNVTVHLVPESGKNRTTAANNIHKARTPLCGPSTGPALLCIATTFVAAKDD